MVNIINKDGYNICENNDGDLVTKIKAMKPKKDIVVGDTIKHISYGECEVKEFINDEDILAYSKNGKYFVHKLDKEKTIREEHLQSINDKYKVSDYYLDNFGILSNKSNIIHNIVDRIKNPFRKESYNEVNTTGMIHESINISNYNSLKFEGIKSHRPISIFFDENGNYVNRNVNFDISKFKPCKPKEFRQNKIEEFLEIINIDDIIKVDESNEVYFTEKYAYKIYNEVNSYELVKSIDLTIDIIPNQGKSYYHKGESKYGYKPKKNLIEVDKSIFINKIRTILEEYYSKLEE